jgi:hypothetical protein
LHVDWCSSIVAPMDGLIVYALLLGLALFVAMTWARWIAADAKFVEPRWRSLFATIGFVFSTSSLVMIIALAIHALVTGGLPYYSRPLMAAFGLGFLTAIAGVLGAILGKGPLEIPTIISSLLCLAFWLMEAVAQ